MVQLLHTKTKSDLGLVAVAGLAGTLPASKPSQQRFLLRISELVMWRKTKQDPVQIRSELISLLLKPSYPEVNPRQRF